MSHGLPVTPIYSPKKPRSSIITPGDTVRLGFLFRGPDGQPVDTDTLPLVSIIQPSGTVIGPTSSGVQRISTGEYIFDFQVDIAPTIGVYRDSWEGYIDGFRVLGEGTFQVNTSQAPAVNTDGYQHLGDDPGFHYSQTAICNINTILKALKRRLKSSGTVRSCDEHGNVVYKDCDIFSTDELVTFIAQSLTMFNQIPHFTMFTFDDTPVIELFFDIFVQGALYLALGAQALIERGREFQISDNGIGFTPPTMSEILNTQYAKEMDNWYDKAKLLKASMPPSPIMLGTLSFTSGASPQVRRLRHLRERRWY